MTGLVALTVTAATAVFLTGAEHLWRRAGRGRVVRARHVGLWLGGVAVILIALLSPIDRLGHELFWVHMVQHMLLVLLAPVLLVASRPGLPLAHALPDRWRTALPRVRSDSPSLLGIVFTVHLAVVLLWHVPVAYQAALAVPLVHALEHATMLGAGLLLWAVLLRRDPRGRTAGLAALTAAATGMGTGVIGVVVVFAQSPVYPWYAATAPAHGLTGVEDQVLAGVVMWSGGGLAYLAATCVLLARWLCAMDRPSRRTVPPAVGWLLVAVVLGACTLGGCTTRGTPQPTAEVLGDREAGRELTLSFGCVTCHDIPGLRAPSGQVGPSLEGFANRRTIAGAIPNTQENLVAWILDPQAILPGNVMPDVGLDEQQARAVAAYLSTLE
ncbi:hypothetical protein BH23ACT9_BH23ACT9_31000 [soil metagenome]